MKVDQFELWAALRPFWVCLERMREEDPGVGDVRLVYDTDPTGEQSLEIRFTDGRRTTRLEIKRAAECVARS